MKFKLATKKYVDDLVYTELIDHIDYWHTDDNISVPFNSTKNNMKRFLVNAGYFILDVILLYILYFVLMKYAKVSHVIAFQTVILIYTMIALR